MRQSILYLFLFVLFLQSCSDTYNSAENLYEMRAVELDCSEPIFENVIVSNFSKMNIVNNTMLLSYYNNQGLSGNFQLLDELTQKEIGWYGEQGYGPDNFMNPEATGFSEEGDTLYVIEWMNNFLHKLAIDKSTGIYSQDFISKINFKDWIRLDSTVRLKNGCYVATVMFGGQTLFALLNQNGDIVRYFGEPPFDETEEWQDFSKLYGEFAVYDNGFYFAMRHFAYIVKYEIDEDLNPILVWEKFYDTPQYTFTDSTFRISATNRNGFNGITTTDEYVFVSYSGIPMNAVEETGNPDAELPQHIVVLKHDGSVVGKIKVKERITRLALSSDKEHLYCKTDEEEVGIIRIPIMEILKKCKK